MQRLFKNAQKRTFHTKEFWAKHVEVRGKSGLSKSAYCRENGLHPVVFSRWEKKLKSGDGESRTPFMELKVSNPSEIFCGRRIEIITQKGTRLLFHEKTDPEIILNLIKALETV